MATNIHTLTYPLAPVACDICAHDERTLAALQRHYISQHDLSIQWRCACCNFIATGSQKVAAHHWRCARNQEAKRAVQHLRSSSESSEEPSSSSKVSNPAGASSGTSQPIGHGAGEVLLDYPSLKNICTQCKATLSSRVALEDHYKKKHARQIYWRCSSCATAHYKTSHSASAHYSKCRKRGPDAESSNAPASSSAVVASGRAAGPRKDQGAGAVRAKGSAKPAIHSASSGEDDPFRWTDAEIRKVAAVRLRLGGACLSLSDGFSNTRAFLPGNRRAGGHIEVRGRRGVLEETAGRW
ncbi:hypothetical protein MTO96_046308 [Rhipicephalus appendiculatus]